MMFLRKLRISNSRFWLSGGWVSRVKNGCGHLYNLLSQVSVSVWFHGKTNGSQYICTKYRFPINLLWFWSLSSLSRLISNVLFNSLFSNCYSLTRSPWFLLVLSFDIADFNPRPTIAMCSVVRQLTTIVWSPDVLMLQMLILPASWLLGAFLGLSSMSSRE